jgi:hypothetical protein
MVIGDELDVLMEPLPCAVTRSVRKNSTGPVSPTRQLAPSLDLMSLTDDGLTVLVCTLYGDSLVLSTVHLSSWFRTRT